MSDRTRRRAITSGIAAGFLLISASLAGAQDKPAPLVRHLDVEAGVGVHWGMADDVPLEDDFYADIGVSAPIWDQIDVDFQLGYFTGRDNDDDDHAGESTNEARDGWHLNTGLRYYLLTDPDTRARPYLSLGASLLTDYRGDDDVTPGLTPGAGLRIRVGDRSGFLVRVPVLVLLEGGAEPSLLPTLNYFIQF